MPPDALATEHSILDCNKAENLADLTEEEVLAELDRLGVSEAEIEQALEAPVTDASTLESRQVISRKIHQRYVRSRNALREKLPFQQVQDITAPQVLSGLTLPQEPARQRTEIVEHMNRPKNAQFFWKVGCQCETCQQAGDRKWDAVHGCSCLLILLDLPPKTRPIRRIKPKGKLFVSRVISDLGSGIKTPVYPKVGEKLPQKQLGSADWTAEVVLLVTSLKTSRASYHHSCRAFHFLCCKGVEFFVIDTNSDVGPDMYDRNLVSRWRHLHWIFRDPTKQAGTTKRDVVVPQITIDGVVIGGISELQALEDEGDLDYILAREACPNCLMNRVFMCGPPPRLNPDGTRIDPIEDLQNSNTKDFCYNCGVPFRKLVNSQTIPGAVLQRVVTSSFRSPGHPSIPSVAVAKEAAGSRLAVRSADEWTALPISLQKAPKAQMISL